MTDRPLRTAAVAVMLLLSCLQASAQEKREAARVAIGYVELVDDPRYVEGAAYAGIEFRTLGRPLPGAELGVADAATVGDVLGLKFELLPPARVATSDAAAAAIRGWVEDEGVGFVLADLPAADLLSLADAVASLPVLIFNISASDDALREGDCRANVAHVIPSDAMLSDALVQYLVTRNWPDILALVGESEADRRLVKALRRSAAKLGAEVVAEQQFALTADPRRRGESNVALMTAGIESDVVFVADSSGEFGRYVPYQTSLPRPVVGTAGLVPHAWHWTWDRHGAPQLQHRFEALAAPRRMNDAAWAAWVAVKAVMQAAMRSDPGDFEAMRAFILGDALRLDGTKGSAMSFRPWNWQLRQPILLATADATIARAPFEPFLHQVNDLDTLGIDAPESTCPLQ